MPFIKEGAVPDIIKLQPSTLHPTPYTPHPSHVTLNLHWERARERERERERERGGGRGRTRGGEKDRCSMPFISEGAVTDIIKLSAHLGIPPILLISSVDICRERALY
jgi:hypothetical protein